MDPTFKQAQSAFGRLARLAMAGGLLLVVFIAGCGQPPAPAADPDIQVSFDPDPPKVGTSQLTMTIRESSGAPLRAGYVDVEGNMNHAGMKPVFSRLEETEPGRYAGSLEFTMGGDWFLLVSGQLSDGRRIDQKIDVPGVQPK